MKKLVLVSVAIMVLSGMSGYWMAGTQHNSSAVSQYTAFSSSLTANSVVVLNNSFFQHNSQSHISTVLTNVFSSYEPYMVIMYGATSYRLEFLNSWATALQSNHFQMPVQLISHNSTKTAQSYSSSLLDSSVIAVSFNPCGEVIGAHVSGNGLQQFINYATGIFMAEQSIIPHISKPVSAAATPNTVTNQYFTGIGYVGWYKETAPKDWLSEQTGWVSGQWTYYEYTYTSPNGTVYYEFATVGQIEIHAYDPYTPYHLFQDTQWNTWQWAGQVLYDHNPQNTGEYTNGYTNYTVTVAFSGASVTVSEQVANKVLNWQDQSDGQKGNAAVLYTFGSAVQEDTTYTLWPGSTGFLDPYKYGGVLPMVVNEVLFGSVDSWPGTYSTPILNQTVRLNNGVTPT
ncbi:MAG: hypothetical protein KIS30_09855 [Thermoplasmata archaeon]|nr:hypothetical protein [Candidatus Sysuiplasma acidicola]MBX8647038.1 hypothetical protein [Candidatus Sysuiplasma acidicola]